MEDRIILFIALVVLAIVILAVIIICNHVVKLRNENKSLNTFTDVLSKSILDLANDISNIKAAFELKVVNADNFKDKVLYNTSVLKATQDTLWEQVDNLTKDNKKALEMLYKMDKAQGAMEQELMRFAEPEPLVETEPEPFNFKQARLNQFLTLKQVSEETGISTSTLSRIENGGSAKPQNLRNLINFYNNL